MSVSMPAQGQVAQGETPPAGTDERSGPAVQTLRRRMLSPFLMRLFMLAKLPLALMAGLRVRSLEADSCAVSVPYGWRTTNPFRSTYFAALAMAAELSTGAIAMMAARSAPVSVALLIVDLKASFGKKATGLTTFRCTEGAKLFAAVEETVATGEPVTARVETVGYGPEGQEVARFFFTWSFKKRSS